MSMPTRPTTEPTLRSMPPVMMTSVMPRAMMPTTALLRQMFTQLEIHVAPKSANEAKLFFQMSTPVMMRTSTSSAMPVLK